MSDQTDFPHVDDDRHAQALYQRMHAKGESLAAASAVLGLTPAEESRARNRLVRLGLLNPESELTVETTTALMLSLEHGHRALDKLVEQHVMTAAVARNYLGLAPRDGDDVHVEFYAREEHATRLAQRLDDLAATVRHEVVALHPPANWDPRRIAVVHERDRIQVAKGVRVRSMHAQIALADPPMRELLRARAARGIEVRIAPVIPTRMLVYDRHLAIVQADPDDLTAGAVLIRSPNVVRSLAAIYDYLWMTASELDDVPRSADGSTLTEQQRAVLRMLAEGAKDDAIARSLGVSTRTVTRVVGELSAMLGAGSRFQAGVRAARLGWLD
ncbi:LuxR C-terminal-related transcriptional regulator [Nonomuraea sp. NPDC059194]|uniref:helix-turn-helix transcriptional regulator n=1 Tax=Nonomuraea sp. NPDC059194 TaxID=3346764 RepID=UPI00367ACD7C